MKDISQLKDFEALKISLASPEEILAWSYGEITKPETINYRTFRAEKEGLFDERIFGPTKDYECYCGKYKRIRYKGVLCDKCGVEVTHSRVRRERMGHINLAAPAAHVWYFRGIPSQMALLLEIPPRNLEAIIYFSSYIVLQLDPKKKDAVIRTLGKEEQTEIKEAKAKNREEIKLVEKEAAAQSKKINLADEAKKKRAQAQVDLSAKKKISSLQGSLAKTIEGIESRCRILRKKLTSVKKHTVMADTEYTNLVDYLNEFAEVETGAEALEKILKQLDLGKISADLKKDAAQAKGQKLKKAAKQLKIVEGLRTANIKPEWMILRHIPVIPPDLRPMVQLEGGRFATSDLNDLYRRIINRNNRLNRLLELGAPEIIIRNEKRMLQEAVDALLDSSKQRRRSRIFRGRKQLRSLADMIKGKKGRFRLNLLGKRVDYSGRSVIVAGPELKLHQCGLPREMALELLSPFVLRELLARGFAPNVKSAKFVLEERRPEVWDIVEELVKTRPVLLNRAPTLHRLSIQAFFPKLTNDHAIQLHPCVCAGYNADFDGDQMAVHLPLSQEAVKEAREMMISTNNLRKPSDGTPFSVPVKDMLLGIYYLTSVNRNLSLHPSTFADSNEALTALDHGKINLRQPIKVRHQGKIIETTVGRLLFNRILPDSFSYINQPVAKSARGETLALNDLIDQAMNQEDNPTLVKMIDAIKDMGFKYATVSGVTLSIMDIATAPERAELINKAQTETSEIDRNFRRGLVTREESRNLTISTWMETTSQIGETTFKALDPENPVRLIIDSGSSKASSSQVNQIAGMKGLIADPMGRIVEMPIKGNYKRGLTGFEYFTSCRGSRKGLTDKGLKTADAGYLTRRLVDVAQDVIVRSEDCRTGEGRVVNRSETTPLASFAQRIVGRYLAQPVKNGRKIIAKAGTLVTKEIAAEIEKASKVTEVTVRSPLTCQTRYGICSRCYGIDLMTSQPVAVGVPVGVVAAQSIGEPGTQLTLRTFWTGGVAGKDITQGLPRVEELFEARTPKSQAIMTEIAGKVKVEKDKGKRKIIIQASDPRADITEVSYQVDPTSEILVSPGDLVAPGEPLTAGYLDLADLLDSIGVVATQRYILNEVQKVYASQGVLLDDKHVEAIISQMFNRVQVNQPGGSNFLPGEVVSRSAFEEENEKLLAGKKAPAEGQLILLGITRASLKTDSFLSAASFQDTSRVLTEAALSGKIDRLLGLKENVIIGRPIPVGKRARLDDR